MSLERLTQWLRCPNCGADLFPTAQLTIGCAAGHRFDVNKRGYVTLVTSGGVTTGDTVQMLHDRAAVLDSGAYSPIADAVIGLLPKRSGMRVMDAGCGTGYYLREALSARHGAIGLALDRSAAAVRLAIRADERISGLVADTWQPFPVRDEACDIILNVFAPHNPSEFHRVLAPGGQLVIVVPTVNHLHELRESAQLLAVPPGKAEDLEERLVPLFEPSARLSVEFTLPLAAGQAELLRDMGPSAFHPHTTALQQQERQPETVTVSVNVVRFDRVA